MVNIVLMYPGSNAWDIPWQREQGILWSFSTWQPPLTAMILGVLYRIPFLPDPMTSFACLQIIMNWLGVYLIGLNLSESARILLRIAYLPLSFILYFNLPWKDPFSLGFVSIGVGLILMEINGKSKAYGVWGTIFILLATLIKPLILFCVIPIVCANNIIKKQKLRFVFLKGLAFIIIYSLSAELLIASIPHENRYPFQYTMFYDLMGISKKINHCPNDFYKLLDPPSSCAEAIEGFRAATVCKFLCPKKNTGDPEKIQLLSHIWVSAIFENFNEYLSTRIDLIKEIFAVSYVPIYEDQTGGIFVDKYTHSIMVNPNSDVMFSKDFRSRLIDFLRNKLEMGRSLFLVSTAIQFSVFIIFAMLCIFGVSKALPDLSIKKNKLSYLNQISFFSKTNLYLIGLFSFSSIISSITLFIFVADFAYRYANMSIFFSYLSLIFIFDRKKSVS